MKTHCHSHSQTGSALLGVLVVVASLGVVMMNAVEQSTQSARVSRALTEFQDRENLHDAVSMVLGTPSSCLESLRTRRPAILQGLLTSASAQRPLHATVNTTTTATGTSTATAIVEPDSGVNAPLIVRGVSFAIPQQLIANPDPILQTTITLQNSGGGALISSGHTLGGTSLTALDIVGVENLPGGTASDFIYVLRAVTRSTLGTSSIESFPVAIRVNSSGIPETCTFPIPTNSGTGAPPPPQDPNTLAQNLCQNSGGNWSTATQSCSLQAQMCSHVGGHMGMGPSAQPVCTPGLEAFRYSVTAGVKNFVFAPPVPEEAYNVDMGLFTLLGQVYWYPRPYGGPVALLQHAILRGPTQVNDYSVNCGEGSTGRRPVISHAPAYEMTAGIEMVNAPNVWDVKRFSSTVLSDSPSNRYYFPAAANRVDFSLMTLGQVWDHPDTRTGAFPIDAPVITQPVPNAQPSFRYHYLCTDVPSGEPAQ